MTASKRVAHEDVGTQLERRITQATCDARLLLGWTSPTAADAETVSALIAAIEAELTESAEETRWREAVKAHKRELEHLRQRYQARVGALKNVERAIARLREITSPRAILGRAPKELCEHSHLERAVLSLISNRFIIAEAAHFYDDPVGAVKALEDLRREPPRLAHPLIETELVRRRRATIVTDAQNHPRVHQPSAKTMDWQAYLAAPLVVRGEVIGVIHADTGVDGRPLDVLDGDVLWTFARGLADVYETTSLRRMMRQQRELTRDFVDWLAARSIELSDTSLRLAAEWPPPPSPPGKLNAISVAPNTDDRLVFRDLLTRRELDVLRLLARGETNNNIAAHLVISDATVKFHVVNLLRKLHVSNRAEAASRYHRLVRARDDS